MPRGKAEADAERFDCKGCTEYRITETALDACRALTRPQQREALSRCIRSCSESCTGNEIPIVWDNVGLPYVRKGVR